MGQNKGFEEGGEVVKCNNFADFELYTANTFCINTLDGKRFSATVSRHEWLPWQHGSRNLTDWLKPRTKFLPTETETILFSTYGYTSYFTH